MQKVLTAAEMREVDRLTTERFGIPSIALMENAARSVARAITEKLGGSVVGKSILILCGKGNNGGDGAALARMLATDGARVQLILFAEVDQTSGDARVNLDRLGEGVELFEAETYPQVHDRINSLDLGGIDCVVDAVFGTGFKGSSDELNEIFRLFEGKLIVSVDMPSGLIADSPNEVHTHFRADLTVTFTAPKPANILPPASRFNGKLIVADIGSPQTLIDEQPSRLYAAGREDAGVWLKRTRFSDDSYKNKRGHCLMIAGSESYSGAAVLAANSAMRSGVGLVTLASPPDAKTEIAARLLPEVILTTIDSPDLDAISSRANAIGVGCGLSGSDPKIESLVRRIVRDRTTPVVVDAGALWFFDPPHGIPKQDADKSVRAPLILTPHEGEFLRLLGADDKSPIEDRVAAVRDFSQKNNVILVLKGERVLIGEPGGRVVVNPTGNSGLGKAGNGDTLTGIIVGFVTQAAAMDIDIFETVVAAVYAAGLAGDVAERKYGKRVMTASDVRECLADVFTELEI